MPRACKRTLRLVLSVSLMALHALGACSAEPQALLADDPLARIVVYPNEVRMYAQPGLPLRELVSIDCFVDRGLVPGMTFGEIAEILGEPAYQTQDPGRREEVAGFRTAAGTFEVVKQQVSSEGSAVDRWFLRLQTNDCSSLIDPRVSEQLQNLPSISEKVALYSGTKPPGTVVLHFTNGRDCTTLWWLQEDSEAEPG